MERAEIQELIAEIAKRHNVLLGPDDPVFVTVTVNEVVLARINAALRSEIEGFLHQLLSASARIGDDFRTAGDDLARRIADGARTGTFVALEDLRAAVKRELALAEASSERAHRAALWSGMSVAAALSFVLTLLALKLL